jgi:hypothetical protein
MGADQKKIQANSDAKIEILKGFKSATIEPRVIR